MPEAMNDINAKALCLKKIDLYQEISFNLFLEMQIVKVFHVFVRLAGGKTIYVDA